MKSSDIFLEIQEARYVPGCVLNVSALVKLEAPYKQKIQAKAVLNSQRKKVFSIIHTESFCKGWENYWFKAPMEMPDKSLTE